MHLYCSFVGMTIPSGSWNAWIAFRRTSVIFGARLADAVLDILELLVEASYSSTKLDLLRRANVKIERTFQTDEVTVEGAVYTPCYETRKYKL